MASRQRQGRTPQARRIGMWLAAIGCVLYVRYRIDPRLVYHAQQPEFFTDAPFWGAALTAPGGAVDYAARLASQYLIYPWIGAAVIASVLGLVCWSTSAASRATSGRDPGWLGLVPGLLALGLHHDCRYPLAADLAVAVPLLGVVLYFHGSRRAGTWGRALLFVVLMMVATAGAGGSGVLYLVCCAAGELARRRPVLAAGLVGLGAAVVYAVATRMYAVGVLDLVRTHVPALATTAGLRPGWIFTASVLLLVLASVAMRGWVSRTTVPDQTRQAPHECRPLLPAPLAAGVIVAVTVGVVVAAPRPEHQARIRLDLLVQQRQWSAALRQARQLSAYGVESIYQVHRALHHEGRLLDRMFSYPVVPGQPVFLPSPDHTSRLVALSDVCFELGCLNRAEHMAHEALEIHGSRPSLLRRLVRINAAKGRPRVAEIFLNRMDRALVHQDWVERCRRAMAASPALAQDPQIARARARAVREDYVGYLFGPEEILLQLLRHEPENRMAFDYLMAQYLLSGQLGKVAAGIRRLDAYPAVYPHPGIPRHCEEALLIHLTELRRRHGRVVELPLGGRRISQQTVADFSRFNAVMAQHPNDREALRAALHLRFGHTYWYYYLFHVATAPAPGGVTS